MKVQYILLVCILVGFSACKKDVPFNSTVQRSIDSEIIRTFISDNNLTADSTASGLYYVIDNPGGAARPLPTSQVTVDYNGQFLSGATFDQSSPGSPLNISLQSVIAGWTEGIPLFGKGGSGKLIIPSHLAYGRFGQGSIPPNTVLQFDITLVNFN